MSNVKIQSPNEYQMTNAKTQKNNHPSGKKYTKAFHGAGETTKIQNRMNSEC
jgi:hypothetical protein